LYTYKFFIFEKTLTEKFYIYIYIYIDNLKIKPKLNGKIAQQCGLKIKSWTGMNKID